MFPYCERRLDPSRVPKRGFYMIIFKKFLFAALAIPVLAACAQGPNLKATKKMSITGDGMMVVFNEALHREYLKLATAEDRENDTDDAHFFNGKARQAAMGKNPGPQAIKERKLPKKNKPELQAARGALVAELGSGGPKYHPAASARAQAMFDCWMQEQEENDQPKDIAACRAAFDKALKQMSARPAPMPAPMVKAKPKPKPMPRKPQNFVVFFDFDSAAITATAQGIINDAIIAAQATGSKKIGIVGHTDRAGSNKYNDALSKRRAGAVREMLMNAGVKAAAIRPAYMGEDDPAVKTPDGTRSSSNRRVTISIN